MRTAGIIMECNPFHKGHEYIIKTAMEIAEGGPVIVVMSGDFVQRGIPAVIPKEKRARQVLNAGADLVLELPVCAATAGAERFARGAVTLLARTGVVTDLVFGSESTDTEYLIRCADFLLREPEAFRLLLKEKASSGLSYPAARAAAAAECSDHIRLPKSANDLLGTEYIKILMELNRQDRTEREGSAAGSLAGADRLSDSTESEEVFAGTLPIRPHAVRRIAADSASALRERMLEEGSGLSADDFSGLLLEKLLMIDRGYCRCTFTDYLDTGMELANRMHRLLPQFASWTQFCSLLKTRDITYTAVSRALTHILLDITADLSKPAEPLCARVLGCRRKSLSLLKKVQERGLILITGHGDAVHRLPAGSSAVRSLQLDIGASETWELVCRMKSRQKAVSNADSRKEKGYSPSSSHLACEPISDYARPFLIV